jgi:hypothetical protein
MNIRIYYIRITKYLSNEYPNIFICSRCYEQISVYICMLKMQRINIRIYSMSENVRMNIQIYQHFILSSEQQRISLDLPFYNNQWKHPT